MKSLTTAAAALAILAAGVAPAAAQVPHSLSLAGPASATAAQPVVLQAAGTVSDDPSVFLSRYVNAYALPASVVAACPATFQNAIQIKDSTTGQGAQSVALAVPVEGSFSVPIAFTSDVPGRFLLCAYLNEGVGTDAMAAHVVDVAPAASGGGDPGVTPGGGPTVAARPKSLSKPTLKRSGRKLVCGRGKWAGGPTRYVYRWTVDGKRKRGASGRKLRITRTLQGRKIRCGVTATNGAGSTTTLSRARRA